MSENFANLSENNLPIYYIKASYQCLKIFACSVPCMERKTQIPNKDTNGPTLEKSKTPLQDNL